jgi:hypothetical protein
MLQFIKRWLQPSAAKSLTADFNALQVWADERQFGFRRVRDEGGVVIESHNTSMPWRLEWGPAQRRWVRGKELRLRAELGFGGELQLLVMTRELQEAMEREVFDQCVGGVQTRIDDQTPPEMRWLVMFPKLSGADAAGLGDQLVAVGNHKTWLTRWLDGALPSALVTALGSDKHPLVLMIGRGRVLLRTECQQPDRATLDAWVKLLETALREARRAHQQGADAHAPQTQPSLWTPSTLPAEEVQH